PEQPHRSVPHPPPDRARDAPPLCAQRPRGGGAAGARGPVVPRPLSWLVLPPRRRAPGARDLPGARAPAAAGVRALPLRARDEADARHAPRLAPAARARARGGGVSAGACMIPDTPTRTARPGRLGRLVKQVRTRANMPVKWAAYRAGALSGPFYPDRV